MAQETKEQAKREKRISLHPLSLKEAVKGLLETKPDKGKGAAPAAAEAEKSPEDQRAAAEDEEG